MMGYTLSRRELRALKAQADMEGAKVEIEKAKIDAQAQMEKVKADGQLLQLV